jgi:hypothetical protein
MSEVFGEIGNGANISFTNLLSDSCGNISQHDGYGRKPNLTYDVVQRMHSKPDRSMLQQKKPNKIHNT